MNVVASEVIEDGRTPFGTLAYAGAGLSVAFCFAKNIVAFVFPALGLGLVDFEINEHAQAGLMSVFALMAVLGLSLDKNRCGSSVPMILGVVGMLIIVGTLYAYYQAEILTIGYVTLLVAAFLNQSVRLQRLNLKVAELNTTLEQRVQSQIEEINNLGRLKRFLPPAVAEMLVNEGDDSRLESHRRHIAALFCDLRGFTAFSETMEPEEVMNVLGTYHEHMGRLASDYEATIDHRAGDGLMLFLNDPIPCETPALKAVQLALDMRETFEQLNSPWKKLGYELGFGVGVASGYATMGIVGFEGRYDYTANGNAVNLAARLCDQATDGQILISRRAWVEVEEHVEATRVEDLHLKGVSGPVVAYAVTA